MALVVRARSVAPWLALPVIEVVLAGGVPARQGEAPAGPRPLPPGATRIMNEAKYRESVWSVLICANDSGLRQQPCRPPQWQRKPWCAARASVAMTGGLSRTVRMSVPMNRAQGGSRQASAHPGSRCPYLLPRSRL